MPQDLAARQRALERRRRRSLDAKTLGSRLDAVEAGPAARQGDHVDALDQRLAKLEAAPVSRKSRG